ncbi:MAG TPA: CotH kinase family protein [Tepidisphaeraceae bacterium]|nr:CotH kinase family protein [Tepidisphaeraceae bacterium]
MRYLLALIVLFALSRPAFAEPIIDKASPLFDPTKMHEIHIELTRDAWKMMEPKFYTIFSHLFHPDPSPTTNPTTRPKYIEGQRLDPNISSFQYAYVRAKIKIDGEEVKDAGLRMKGNSSYSSAAKTLHVPLKIDFNRFVPGQKFHGLTTINLHNNAFDKSQMREHLAYQVFREAGLPASRTAYAKVFLTIPGKYDRKEIGLYSIVEEVDKDFLKTRFPSSKGLLLKPEIIAFGLRDMGDDWKDYTPLYLPRWEATPKQSRRLIEFVRLIDTADDKTFAERIDSYLNTDQFLRNLAVNTITVNLDSFLAIGHNFLLYLNPTDNKFYFIPWDMNLAFAGFVWLGSPQELTNLSITHPHVADNKLIERLLAIDSMNQIYRHHLSDLLATVLSPEKLEKQIDDIDHLIRPEGVPLAERKGPDWNIKVPPLRDFPRRRAQAVQAQLNGADGYRPSFQINRMLGLPPNPAIKAVSTVKEPTTKPAIKP